MQRLAFKRDLSYGIIFAVSLKPTDVDALLFAGPGLGLDHFADSLASRVVDVKGLSTSAQLYLLQLVLEVPAHLHAVDGSHAAMHVAALCVCIGVCLSVAEAVTYRRSTQPIVLQAS